MPWSRIFGHWARKLLSVVARLFLGSNICGTPFPQTFTIFWQVSQMWLTWAYWVERKKQSVVFTRNANMTFSGWRQSLFPAHGRGNKKRWIFIVILNLFTVQYCGPMLSQKSCFKRQKTNFVSLFQSRKGREPVMVSWFSPPMSSSSHPPCPGSWVWHCLEELFLPGDGADFSQSNLPWEQSVSAHPGVTKSPLVKSDGGFGFLPVSQMPC